MHDQILHVITHALGKSCEAYLGVLGAGFALLLFFQRTLVAAGLEVANRRSQTIDIGAQRVALQRCRQGL